MKPTANWADAHLGTDSVLETPAITLDLKRMLESAVILNWDDVMANAAGGLVDVEYKLAPDGSLEYLRLWACSRKGFCDLICQYSLIWKWSNAKAVSFGAGYDSTSLARCLDYIIQHETQFATTQESHKGLVQVQAPSETQRKLADVYVSGVLAA